MKARGSFHPHFAGPTGKIRIGPANLTTHYSIPKPYCFIGGNQDSVIEWKVQAGGR